ncbi:MAG: DHH family phosphoesterase [Candidatus Freyarchaeota archaeon]
MSEGEGANMAIICHQNADPDALCSAYALKHLIGILGYKGEISVLSDEVSILASNIAGMLNIEYSTSGNLNAFNLFIVVDTCNPEQLGKFHQAPLIKPTLTIDHHSPKPEKGVFKESIVDPKATSTSEIIAELFKKSGKEISREVCTALLIGILYDSRSLYLATPRTLKTAAFLLEKGGDYTFAHRVLKGIMDRAEKIARLKAAKRAEITDVNGWIIVFTRVGSYEASACRGLIELGADVAIVGTERKDEIRISARATKEFYERTRVHLGKVMNKLGKTIGGSGGGHTLAAGFNATSGDLEDAFQTLQTLLRNVITREKRENDK